MSKGQPTYLVSRSPSAGETSGLTMAMANTTKWMRFSVSFCCFRRNSSKVLCSPAVPFSCSAASCSKTGSIQQCVKFGSVCDSLLDPVPDPVSSTIGTVFILLKNNFKTTIKEYLPVCSSIELEDISLNWLLLASN